MADDFDRDAFIKQATQPQEGFDRDAFLKENKPKADDLNRDQANKLLAQFHASGNDLAPDEVQHLVDVAYKGVTPQTTLANAAKGVYDAFDPTKEHDYLGKAWSGIKTGADAIGGLLMPGSTADQDAYAGEAPKPIGLRGNNLAAGVAAAPLDVLNAGQSLATGAADLVDQGMPGSEGRRLARIARSETLAHDINKGVQGIHAALGASQEDPLDESARFGAQFAIPIGAAGKTAPLVAKAADYAVERAPEVALGVARGAKPLLPAALGVGTGLATGSVIEGLGAAGIPIGYAGVKNLVKKLVSKAADPKAESEFSQVVNAIDKAPYQTPVYTYIRGEIDKEADRLSQVEQTLRKQNKDKLLNVDDPSFSIDDLKGADKEVREKMEQIKSLRSKSDALKFKSDVNKVLSYAGKLTVASAGEAAVGAGTMAGISASGAQPENVEQSAKEGAETGMILATPFAPKTAAGALKDLSLSRGRTALVARGTPTVDQDSLKDLPPEAQTHVNMLAGAADALGKKVKVVSPDELLSMVKPEKPEVIPAKEGAPAMPPPTSEAPNGLTRGDTLYLNKEALGSGVGYHEFTHATQEFFGKALRESDPALMKKFEDAYAERLGKTGDFEFSAQQERDAEVGRILLSQTPLESFYGGEKGPDVIKRIGRKVLSNFSSDAPVVDPTLSAPYNKADTEEMRARMFQAGEQAAKPPAQAPPPSEARPQVVPATTTPSAKENAPTAPANEAAVKDAIEASKALGIVDPEAKIGAAVKDLESEGKAVTAEELTKRASQRSVPKLESATLPPKEEAKGPLSEAKIAPDEKLKPTKPTVIKPEGPDYQTIRAEAETKKSEELAGTKRKTKQAEIDRAGLEAMAQAHAEHVGPDSDLVTWRTNKFGKTSISGKRIDPKDPFHAHLLEQAKLSDGDVQKLNDLEKNIGNTVSIDYLHAPEGAGEASAPTRKAEQAESTAPERVSGDKAQRRLSKSYVPTNITFNASSKTFEVNGFSPDKFLNNADYLIPWAKNQGLQGYDSVNDPNLTKDFNDMVENHKNGYTTLGKPIEGTDVTKVKTNKDYEPHVIPKDRADLLNAMLGNEGAREGVRAASPEKLDKQKLAQQNSPFWEASTGETNRVRSLLGEERGLLEPTTETLRPELIERVRKEPIDDKATLRPSGFEGDRAKLMEKGAPRSDFAAGGFMPSTQTKTPEFKKWFGDSKVKDENGEPLVLYHGTAIEKTQFRRDRSDDMAGAYFTSSPESARDHAETDASIDDETPYVYPVYLSIKNPKILKGSESHVITPQQRSEWERSGHDGAYNPEIDEWVAFEPTQIKSATGNSGAFDPKNPDIRFMPATKPFYSQLERTIESQPDKANPDQLRAAILKGPGVKAAELRETKDALGTSFEQWLKDNPKATKNDMLDFVRENQVQLKEVEKGKAPDIHTPEVHDAAESMWSELETFQQMDYMRSDHRNAFEQYVNEEFGNDKVPREVLDEILDNHIREGQEDDPFYPLDDEEKDTLFREMADNLSSVHGSSSTTKFGGYQLPGGKDYGETLVTLPKQSEAKELLRSSVFDEARKLAAESGEEWTYLGPNARETYMNLAQHTMDKAQANARGEFRSSHWEEPNVALHLRHAIYDTSDGKKTWLMEELQSDFGQKLRQQDIHNSKLIDQGFDGILDQMKKDGILEIVC